MALAADDYSGAFAERVGDVFLYFLQALLVDQRADHHAGLVPGPTLNPFTLSASLAAKAS